VQRETLPHPPAPWLTSQGVEVGRCDAMSQIRGLQRGTVRRSRQRGHRRHVVLHIRHRAGHLLPRQLSTSAVSPFATSAVPAAVTALHLFVVQHRRGGRRCGRRCGGAAAGGRRCLVLPQAPHYLSRACSLSPSPPPCSLPHDHADTFPHPSTSQHEAQPSEIKVVRDPPVVFPSYVAASPPAPAPAPAAAVQPSMVEVVFPAPLSSTPLVRPHQHTQSASMRPGRCIAFRERYWCHRLLSHTAVAHCIMRHVDVWHPQEPCADDAKTRGVARRIPTSACRRMSRSRPFKSRRWTSCAQTPRTKRRAVRSRTWSASPATPTWPFLSPLPPSC
jgi:hypothetical protein